MTAIQIADSFDSFAIDHTPDGWPAVQQKQLTEAAAELRRLEAQLQKETAARQAAQIEAEALKERLVRADAEKCAAVLAERIAPNAPVQEPVAFVSPDDLEDMRGPEYAAGAYFRMRATPAGKYVQPIYTAPQPDRIAQLEAANTNLFEQGQKMYKRIQELEMDCKIGAQEMVKAYEEIDNLKAQVSWQKPVAWCQLGLGGKSIAYFDGKPMIMTGHVGNQHHPTPLFTAQPRKAVKLTMHQIAECHPRLYGLDEDMLEFARAIEQAVLKANGIEP